MYCGGLWVIKGIYQIYELCCFGTNCCLILCYLKYIVGVRGATNFYDLTTKSITCLVHLATSLIAGSSSAIQLATKFSNRFFQ